MKSLIKIGTVISYCTLDYRFIKLCTDQVRPFSSQIIIVSADHFFDGTPENSELLKKTYTEVHGVDMIGYKWQENQPKYWHNMARWIGLQYLKNNIDFVLFLDADEIADNKFNEWLERETFFSQYDAFLFLCYWYFREPRYRAKTWEKAGLLVRKNKLTRDNIFTTGEREGIVYSTLPNAALINGMDGRPMVHHYSWVRTKEEMLKKVKSWGHRDDIEWERLVEEEFKRDFTGTDFVPGHHYEYETIEPIHDIKLRNFE
ncbi:MAG: hypothetical protein FJ240_08645 [Nitrospira sp.]|nr:hypothetical protein [Nitrospira sp.]